MCILTRSKKAASMDDLISEFIGQTSESLGVLDAELVKLDRNPNDAQVLATIHRLVRTIKSTCGFLELRRLESIAEAAEEVLADVKDGTLAMTPDISFALLESLSSIRHIIDYLAKHGQEPDGSDAALLQRLRHVVSYVATPAAEKVDPAPSIAPSPTPVSSPAIEEELPVAAVPLRALANDVKPQPLSVKHQRDAIRHGLEVTAPASASVGMSAGTLQKLADTLGDVIHARNQLMAQHDLKTNAMIARLTQAATSLKTLVEQGERALGAAVARPVVPVIMLQAAGLTMALAQHYVLEVVDLSTEDAARVATINNTQVLILGKRVLPLVKLRSLLKISDFPSMREERVVVVRVGAAEFGLVVEEACELLETVQYALPRSLQHAGVYRGAVLSTEDTPLLLLDAAGLARLVGYRQVEDIVPQTVSPQAPGTKGFLVFRAGSSSPKAILLDHVIRVEEITPQESAIAITALPGARVRANHHCEAVIISTGAGSMALAIDKVIDIMYAPYELRHSDRDSYYLGTLNIGGKATELVNVEKLAPVALLEAA